MRIDIPVAEPVAWLLLKPKRIKILVGGRGSQKSTGVGDSMLVYAATGERVCCAREFQNSIDDSVHENLKTEIDRLQMPGFNPLKTEINHCSGGQLFYKGLARNIQSLKSLSNVQKLWIEEGESVSHESLKVLTPSVRSSAKHNQSKSSPPEIWITMNWGRSTGAIAEKYLKRAMSELQTVGRYEDDLVMIAVVNWRDNPWFPPELEQERLDDFKNLPRAEYDAIWENAFSDSVPGSIILAEWFDAAIDAHKVLGFEPEGVKVVSHDPADGGDAKAIVYRHGSVILDAQEMSEGFVADGGRWFIDYALDVNADVAIWDGDGLGLGLRDQVSKALQGKHTTAMMFHGSQGVSRPNEMVQLEESSTAIRTKKRKDFFLNKRAEFYWELKQRFYKTYQAVVQKKYINPDELISISSEIKLLSKMRAEICSIPRKYGGSGKFQILDKAAMKKAPYKLASPNLADACMMSLDLHDFDVTGDNVDDIQFASLWD